LPLTDLPPFPDPVPFSATFAPSVHAFVAAVHGESVDIATGEDGLRAMEVEHAIVVSAQAGKVVPLPMGD
jgi:predicted dehydrogenase